MKDLLLLVGITVVALFGCGDSDRSTGSAEDAFPLAGHYFAIGESEITVGAVSAHATYVEWWRFDGYGDLEGRFAFVRDILTSTPNAPLAAGDRQWQWEGAYRSEDDGFHLIRESGWNHDQDGTRHELALRLFEKVGLRDFGDYARIGDELYTAGTLADLTSIRQGN